MQTTKYPCGHPRIPENTWRVGVNNGVPCKACRQVIKRRSYEKRKRELTPALRDRLSA